MIKFEFETSADYKPDVKHKIWINNSIRNEGKIPGEISYLFCDDDYMIGQNIHFLNHDTFTDIITFSENVGKVINGSILVSLDRIKENSNLFGVSFEKELLRVMIHGALHLCGYGDKTEAESITMRAKEDFYISKFVQDNF